MEATVHQGGSLHPVSHSTSDRYGIVVFSHLRWKFVWQRPQQFLSRFAERHPVLFVELTDFDGAPGSEPRLELETVAPNVTVANIHMDPALIGSGEVDKWMLALCKEAIASVNGSGAFDQPLQWFYSPMDAGWALGKLSGRGIVYDCMDELAQFKDAPPELLERENRLMQAADVVFTGGYELYMKKSRQHPNVHFFGCGVEYAHFAQAQDTSKPLPQDVADLARPIVGWFGVVDERVDYDLLARAAEMRPNYQFVMVGPVVKVDPTKLPQAPNLHWLGGRDYQVLPDYCRAYDVCMMCFALNEATEYINPTKALEYLATGKPVVATAVKDVVRQYSDTVLIATNADEFVEVVDRALERPDETMIARGIERAKAASWESTVQQMLELIDEALSSKVRAYPA